MRAERHLRILRFAMSPTSRSTALRAAVALFVAAQLAFAAFAACGSHRHAWDLAADAACWICLVVALTSVAAVLGAACAFSEAPLPSR